MLELDIVPVLSIHVVDRARQVFDRHKLDELKKSISELGVLEPLVVCWTEDIYKAQGVKEAYRLLAGERRLRVCNELGIKEVPVHIITGDCTRLSAKCIEAAENFYREDLTAEERVLLVKEIHEEQVRLHGERISSYVKDGWSQKDTADLLGVSPATVSLDLQAAQVISMYPTLDLTGVKKTDLINALQRMKQEGAAAQLNSVLEAGVKEYIDTATKSLADSLIVQPTERTIGWLPELTYNIAILDFRTLTPSMDELQANVLEKVYLSLQANSWLLVLGYNNMSGYNAKDFYIRLCFDTTPATIPLHTLIPDVFHGYYIAKGNPQLHRPGTRNTFSIQKRREYNGDVHLYSTLLDTFAYPGCKLLVPFVYTGQELIEASKLGIIPTGYTHDIIVRNIFLRLLAEGELDGTSDIDKQE